jgi:hypothetical protein
MGYELRTNTIEPRRSTFDPVRERFGDKPASRYQEATYAGPRQSALTPWLDRISAGQEQCQWAFGVSGVMS